jgi:prepilin-type processing-associated H-X9-DG protein
VLTTLFLGQGGPSRRDRGLTSCRHNLEKIYLAMEVYAHDYHDSFPVAAGSRTAEDALAPLFPRYTSDTEMFICPASRDVPLPPGQSFRNGKISYAYYMGRFYTNDTVVMSDEQVSTLPKSNGAMVFSNNSEPPGNNHGKNGGNFLLCDGSVVSSQGDAPFSLMFTPPVVLLNPKP